MNKTFIAISSETLNEKLVYLTTSDGTAIFNENGINSDTAIEWLFNLVHKRKRTSGVVFVTYAFSRDNEFIFSTLPRQVKDKLFQSHTIKAELTHLEDELEQIENDYYRLNKDTQEFELADFERYVNKLSITHLKEVKYKGYHISLANGKVLTIRKNGKAISIYDIYGFFKPATLKDTIKKWLMKDIIPVTVTQSLSKRSVLNIKKTRSIIEAHYISQLAASLNEHLSKCGIRLTRWHGASAITSQWLNQCQAKDSFHSYKYKRQLGPELWKAVHQAFYGGRAEQFKIGTIQDVNIYDINSAYGFACTFLPIFLRKPFYVQKWQPSPFSLWFCEYDFRNHSSYFGYLPNRGTSNFTQYKLKGRGYFWQPEVAYVLANFPECVEVKGGFVLDEYTPAPFTSEIKRLYDVRSSLQENDDPLADVIKLALSSLYGKFCQHQGKSKFYNIFYAGFITSLTRSMLLDATKGHEEQTICFQTDAIHTTAQLPVLLSGDLGEYKQSKYNSITYLDNGVYRAQRNGVPNKIKSRGFRSFDFESALEQLKEKLTYTGVADIFIGHNLFSKEMFTRARYLEQLQYPQTMRPAFDEKRSMRIFDRVPGLDLSRDYLDSKPISTDSGIESGVYRLSNYTVTDAALDSIVAGRV